MLRCVSILEAYDRVMYSFHCFCASATDLHDLCTESTYFEVADNTASSLILPVLDIVKECQLADCGDAESSLTLLGGSLNEGALLMSASG